MRVPQPRAGMSRYGGHVAWDDIATKLKLAAPVLAKGQRRVLTLYCCHSKAGVKALKPLLSGHFTGIYHFEKKFVQFADAMTTWAVITHAVQSRWFGPDTEFRLGRC